MNFLVGMFPLFVFFFIVIPMFFRVVKEYERAIIFRLGRLIPAKGPGLIFVLPIIDKVMKVNMRLITLDVPPQDVIKKIMYL